MGKNKIYFEISNFFKEKINKKIMEPKLDVFAYYMKDGFTYVGKREIDSDSPAFEIRDFMIMPTIKIAQDSRTPEVTINEEYNSRNKGLGIFLRSENKIGSSNISLAFRLKKRLILLDKIFLRNIYKHIFSD